MSFALDRFSPWFRVFLTSYLLFVQDGKNVAISYANALVDLAQDSDVLEAVHTDVAGLEVSIAASSISFDDGVNLELRYSFVKRPLLRSWHALRIALFLQVRAWGYICRVTNVCRVGVNS